MSINLCELCGWFNSFRIEDSKIDYCIYPTVMHGRGRRELSKNDIEYVNKYKCDKFNTKRNVEELILEKEFQNKSW